MNVNATKQSRKIFSKCFHNSQACTKTIEKNPVASNQHHLVSAALSHLSSLLALEFMLMVVSRTGYLSSVFCQKNSA